jgi:hypothetical protein
MEPRWAIALIGGSAAVAAAAALLAPPIPQDPAYHRLVDSRVLLGIPNALNVLSNAAFVLVGALGLHFALGVRSGPDAAFQETRERWPYVVFFGGLLLTGFGSAYYHWEPGNARLAWDRLPLAITVIGLLDATISDRVGLRPALWLLAPLAALAVFSVGYWHVTEQRGAGDLRLYALVQFYPIVAVPVLLWLLPARYTRGTDLLAAAATYALAKVPELLDAWVFALTRVVSGHTLKHLLAALAGYWVLRMLKQRRPTRGI